MPTVRPTRDVQFQETLQHNAFPSVSIFVGNNQPWPGNRRAMLALKGEVKRCRELLAEAKVSDSEAEELLAPLSPWLEEGERWKNVAQSLILYISKGDFRFYEVDLELTDSSHVGQVYDLRALIPLKDFQSFYLLEVSQDRSALHCITPSSYETVSVPDLPESFEEFTQYNDRERSLQHRTFQSPASRDALFHGHGVAKDSKKLQLERYATAIGGSLQNYLDDKFDPLLIVGLNPLSALVRETDFYSRIRAVWDRDPTSEPLASLVDSARKEYRDVLLKEQNEAVEEGLKYYISRPGVETRIPEILMKAYSGQVRQLFVRHQHYAWGQFFPEDASSKVYRERLPGTEDLLNLASVLTLRTGGEVFIFDSFKYQAPNHALAVLR